MSRATRLGVLLTIAGWLGLIAVGVMLYMLWTDTQTRFLELRDRQLETHQSAHQALMDVDRRLTGLSEEQYRTQALVDQFLEELRIRYTAYETLLQQKLAPISIAPDPRQYPAEELAFLLQIAQYKQNYLQDSLGTLSALRQARQVLDSLDPVHYHTLIQQVDQAISTLEGYRGEEAEHAHRILTGSWLVLSEKIAQLQAEVEHQNEVLPTGNLGQIWDSIIEQFDEHIKVERGAPQAVQTISAYQHVLILYAAQTELYLARLALQSHRADAYAQSLDHALDLLSQPALENSYPALKHDLEALRERHPFPPSIDFDQLTRTLPLAQ